MTTRTRRYKWKRLLQTTLVCCVLGFFIGNFSAAPAYAQDTGGSGTNMQSECQKYQGLINHIGSCIKDTVEKVAVKYFVKMYVYFLMAMNTFLTLGIIIYGVLLAAGMVENVKRDTLTLLLKIAFVVFFAQNLEMLYFWIIQAMDGLIELFFQFSTSMDEGQCSQGGQGFTPFNRLDCLMDLVIGIKTSAYNGSYSQKISGDGVSRGLINFFFKSGISSSLGMVIAGIGFAMIYTLVFTVIRVVFLYLTAIIALSFVIMLGPIFIPLVIFKVTKNYFDKWVNMIVGLSLQPVIMFAYVACMVIAFDKAVFSGSNSLVSAIVGPEANQPNFNLNNWMVQHKVIDRESPVNIENKAGNNMKDTSNLVSGDASSATPAGIRSDESKDQNSQVATYAQGLPINKINWKKLAEARGMEEKELMKQIMYAMVFVGLVVYVFNSMLRHIPSIAADVTGGIYDTPNLSALAGNNPLSGIAGNLGGKLTQGLQKMTGMGR